LKPWMMICLICIVANQAMPGIYGRAGGNGMRESGLATRSLTDASTREYLAGLSPLMVDRPARALMPLHNLHISD
jgi:hypothetical protein